MTKAGSVITLLVPSWLFLSCVVNYLLFRNGLEVLRPPLHQVLQSFTIQTDERSIMGHSRHLRSSGEPRQSIVASDEKPAQLSVPPASLPSTSSTEIPFRMLLGIFTTNTPQDVNRRKLIRRTYLSYYEQINSARSITGTNQSNRICSLADLIQGNATNLDDCQLVYTFVTGGADPSDLQAPTELLTNDPDTPITLERPHMMYPDDQHKPVEERDVTYLNIRENMNEGKTATWFKYASTYLPDHLNIDMIAKVDTDTVVLPPSLLNEVERQLSAKDNIVRPPTLVYGGHKITSRHYYIQGGFYFLSKDLAQYITSDECSRSEIVEAHLKKYGNRAEDREVGAFVKRRERGEAQKAQRLYLPEKVGAEHYKRFKNEEKFVEKWQGFLAKEIARQLYQVKILLDEGVQSKGSVSLPSCPPESTVGEALHQFDIVDEPAIDAVNEKFGNVLNLTRAKIEFSTLLGACATTSQQ